MRGKKNLLFKLPTLAFFSKLFRTPQKKTKKRLSRFRILGDFYKDYKSLKRVGVTEAAGKHSFNSKDIKHNMYPRVPQQNGEDSESVTSPSSLSRRQKLLDLAKSTKDSYLPRFSLITSNIGIGNQRNDPYSDRMQKLPDDALITLYPTYTRKSPDGTFLVDIRGVLACPGAMTRKNRLIISLAKQIVRYGTVSSMLALSNLKEENSTLDLQGQSDASSFDAASVHSESSLVDEPRNPNSRLRRPATSSFVGKANIGDDVLKDRLAHFMDRTIAGAELEILIGSHEPLKLSDLHSEGILTDQNGSFDTVIEVSYLPSVIHVKSNTCETICAFQDPMIIDEHRLGLISDIDDTVKVTGVVGDKRELLRNLLVTDVESWKIPSIIKWYQELYESKNFAFFYVSNSPWQLYGVIHEYFAAVGIPPGSMHLKQYSGNILASIMESSSSRKKKSLRKILNDFPSMDFVCVGDSGEYDLEAYVDLANAYPGRILSINIRYVENSLSDTNDLKVLRDIKRILSLRKKNVKHAEVFHDDTPDLIDLGESKKDVDVKRKQSPIVPNKPNCLRSKQVAKKPPLPERKYLLNNQNNSLNSAEQNSGADPSNSFANQGMSSDSNLFQSSTNIPCPTKNRSRLSSNLDARAKDSDVFLDARFVFDILSYYELEDVDTKGSQWISRMIEACRILAQSETEIKFFTDDESSFFSDFRKRYLNLARK